MPGKSVRRMIHDFVEKTRPREKGSKYEEWAKEQNPPSDIAIERSAPTIDLASAKTRQAYEAAVANGYEGSYAQYVRESMGR